MFCSSPTMMESMQVLRPKPLPSIRITWSVTAVLGVRVRLKHADVDGLGDMFVGGCR